ncbi:hypothetical protein GOBAR_DD00872 [Gossypium barbadense]|nr:hypothetical protein GOBAR_DD00872 [Gossypium barbadense]
MFSEEEYYKNLYFWGKFACDPHVRYSGGEHVRLKEDPDTISYFDFRTLQDNLRVVWNDSTTIDMLNYCVKQKEINLYVKHEIDTVIFADDDLLLVVVIVEGFCGGNKCVEGLNGEGVKVVGSKGDEGLNKEGVEVCGKGGEGGEVEGVEGLNGEGGDRGLNSSVEEFDEKGVEDESDSDLEDANVYVIKVMYFSDGDGDEELQEARQNVQFKSAIRKYSMCCRRKLKLIMNEPNRVRIKCIASKKFRNKMVNGKVILEHFEATIRDHKKMKLREIQRRVDYADELILKNPGSTIKMTYKIDEGVINELFFKNMKVWTNAFQGLHSMSDIVDNNLCKAFNSSIMESRFKSIIITMLEEIITKAYAYALQPINGSHEWGKSCIELVLPPVEKIMLVQELEAKKGGYIRNLSTHKNPLQQRR